MKKVLVLTTGGTIASKPNLQTGLYTSGAMNADELIDRKKINFDVMVETESFSQIPSNAMNFDLLLALKDRIHAAFSDPQLTGVVITHGTDTLEESSYFLNLCVDDERPVVMTGSQRTPQEEGTDAYANIQDAIIAAASPLLRGTGVTVLFNEGIYSARYVRKMHSFNPDAFTSYGFGMLGYVDGELVHMVQRPMAEKTYAPRHPIPPVVIIKASLGGDGLLIDAAVNAGVKGIVLEGFGRGHIPPDACDAVSRATAAGVHVLITTACEIGRVFPVYDFQGGVKDLEKRGAIQGYDYASKKARIKLGILLASGTTDREDIANAFLQ